jgi:hypothetical protein
LTNWIKKEGPTFVVYKKLILQTEISIALGLKGRRFTELIAPENRQE